jgi:hypothetical protein
MSSPDQRVPPPYRRIDVGCRRQIKEYRKWCNLFSSKHARIIRTFAEDVKPNRSKSCSLFSELRTYSCCFSYVREPDTSWAVCVETGNASSITRCEITTPLAPDIEPTPLPPVTVVHGETIQPWYISLPVAQHPSFVQSSVHKFDGSQCEHEFAADAATATSGESGV